MKDIKKYVNRLHACEDKLDEAIKCLSLSTPNERVMIKDLKAIREAIDATIIYHLK